MLASLRRFAKNAGFLPLVLLAVALAVWAARHVDGQARDDAARDGLYITIPNPIDDAAVRLLETTVDNAIARDKRKIDTIIFDFNPDGQASGTSDVFMCMKLKDYLLNLRSGRNKNYPQLRLVAYVNNEVTRHTVLPVLACHELVMSQQGKLGQVLREGDEPLTPEARTAYEKVASLRGDAYRDIVRKMLDRDLVIVRVKTKDGVRYVDRKEAKDSEIDPEFRSIDAGTANTLFDYTSARTIGLCKAIYNSREHVIQAYRLPASSLDEDVILDRPVVWRIDVRSTIDKGSLSSLERRIRRAVGRKANLIILNLESEGGDTTHVLSLAKSLRELKDDTDSKRVKTIAYVAKDRSLGAATFLALGCNEIVMSPKSHLGDFHYLRTGPVEKLKDKLKAPREMLVDLATKRGRPRALFEAMLDPDLVPYRVQHRHDPNYFWVMSEDELASEEKAAKEKGVEFLWTKAARIPIPPNEFLKLDAKMAQEWRIARYTDVEDFDQLCAKYNIDPTKVKVSRDDLLDHVAEFFRNPIVQILLIMVGIAGLILELKMPGLGIPGVVAALCFVLFFWSNSYHSDFTMLAVFLFVLGLALIGLEIFVIPGFGVTGISGILLLVASLVLVTMERLPETASEVRSLGGTLLMFAGSAIGAIVAAFLVARSLPSIPYASRLMLNPPAESEEFQRTPGDRPELAAALLGAIGVAATPLRPAGKARFGEEFLDVIAEGDYVNPGSRVQVIEIESNRIVVKQV
jgi:membrane-bound serine protease (ClpP class)